MKRYQLIKLILDAVGPVSLSKPEAESLIESVLDVVEDLGVEAPYLDIHRLSMYPIDRKKDVIYEE